MEAVSSSISTFSGCDRDMELLLEAFGSSLSLETIAAAYSQASHNVDLAGVILYELHGTSSVSYDSKDSMPTTSVSALEHSSEDSSNNSCNGNGNGPGLSANNHISGISEGDCMKSTNRASRNQSIEVHSKKPIAASCSKNEKDDGMHADIEEFLFNMLGDGFQYDMKMINEVLGLCGYDMEKSMETLVDLSASTLEKSDDVLSASAEKEMHLKIGSISEKSQSSQSNDRLVKPTGKVSRNKNNDKSDLQREILGALFAAPERVGELPKRTSAQTKRVRTTYGRTPVEAVKETLVDQTFVAVNPVIGHIEGEDEDSFPVLRQAVKEYWTTMKEYYKAATDAYTKGDLVRAHKFMKEGQFYNRKAREADEKSAQKLLETRDDEMILDISTLEPKEAIKLLKLHLTKLAGIATFRFLKVFVGDDVGEGKKRSLKRLVLKLLEKGSIQWNEGKDGKTILIKLDEIDPKTLNFSKE